MATVPLWTLWAQMPPEVRALLIILPVRCWPVLIGLRLQLAGAHLAQREMPEDVSRRRAFVRYLIATQRMGDG